MNETFAKNENKQEKGRKTLLKFTKKIYAQRRERNTEGYDAIAYAIIGQAVEDYKVLCRAGVIQNGQCVSIWPRTISGKVKKFVAYNSRTMVVELLYFLKCGGMKSILEQLDSQIDAERILSALGLKHVER